MPKETWPYDDPTTGGTPVVGLTPPPPPVPLEDPIDPLPYAPSALEPVTSSPMLESTPMSPSMSPPTILPTPLMTSANPLTFFQNTLAALPEDKRQYFSDNPDMLESFLVNSRISAIQEANPSIDQEAAFDLAYGEFAGEFDKPQLPPGQSPVPADTANTRWFPHKAMDTVVRGLLGVVPGAIDFGLEATSAVGRTIDYLGEALPFGGIDVFTDDDANSFVNVYKEGLSEDTKERMKSLSGTFEKANGIGYDLGENLTTIAAGAWLVGVIGAAGAAVKLGGVSIGGYLGATRGAQAGATFLAQNQKLATIMRWSVEGAKVDVSAALFADPGTILGLAPETAAPLIETFNQLGPLQKRGWNLAEGLFLNAFIGGASKLIKGAKGYVTGSDAAKAASDAASEMDLLARATQLGFEPQKLLEWHKGVTADIPDVIILGHDSIETVLKAETSVLSNVPPVRTSVERTMGGISTPSILKEEVPNVLQPSVAMLKDTPAPFGDIFKPLRDLLPAERTMGLPKIETPPGLSPVAMVREAPPVPVVPMAPPVPRVVIPEVILPTLKTAELKSIEAIVSRGSLEFPSTPFSAAQKKLLDSLETEATKLGMSTAELVGRLHVPKAAVTNVPLQAQIEIAAVAKVAAVAPEIVAKGNHVLQTPLDIPVFNNKLLKTVRGETPELAAELGKLRSFLGKVPGITSAEAKPLGIPLKRANKILEAAMEPTKNMADKSTLLIKADLTSEVLEDVIVVSNAMAGNMAKARKTTPQSILNDFNKAVGADIKASKGKVSSLPLPVNTIKYLLQGSGNVALGAVKVAGRFMDWSGMLGGASTVYLGGLDLDRDGRVDFTDIAIGALGFSLGGIISARSAVRKEALETLGRTTLVKYLEKDNQSIASVYLMTKELLENSAVGIDPRDMPKYKSIVTKLEKYLLGSNDNVQKLLNDPEVIKRLKGAHVVEFTPEGITELGNFLRMNKEYLPVGTPFRVGMHNFIDPGTFQKEFDTLHKVAHDSFVANDKHLTTVHLTAALDRMVNEYGISITARERLLRGTPAMVASRIHVTRGLMASLDSEIRTLAQIPFRDERQTFDLVTRINQRRGIGEYLRNGGIAGGDTFNRALGQANRGALLGMHTIDSLKAMDFTKETMETLDLAMKALREGPALDGARMTRFMDELGANPSMGKTAWAAFYTGLFSNPLTAGKAWTENAMSLSTAIVSEGISTAIGVLRGNTTADAFIGQKGFLMGLVTNIGGRARETLDMLRKGGLGFDSSANKEFADYRGMSKIQKTLGLQDATMMTRGMNHIMKWMGLDPLAMTLAPDMFFKGILYDGYMQKHIMEAAFDNAQSLKGLTVDQAIKQVENSSEAMAAIRVNSLKKARDYTFTSDLSESKGITQSLIGLRTKNPMLRLLLPIFKTPLIAARHFQRHTPILGLLVREDGEAFASWVGKKLSGKYIDPVLNRKVNEIGGRMTAGLVTATAAWYMLDTLGWDITGSGKFDPGMQAKMAQGVMPFSLTHKGSGGSVDLSRLVHFKATLGMMADIRDKVEHWQDGEVTSADEAAIEAIAYTMSMVFENSSPDQVGDLISLFGASRDEGSIGSKAKAVGADLVSKVMPSIFKAVGNDADPLKRATSNQIERAMAAYYSGMGVPENTRPALDINGEPKRRDAGVTSDPLMDQIEESGYKVGDYMRRRATVGGLKLDSSKEQQEIAYVAESLHGAEVKRMTPQILKQLAVLPDGPSKKELLSRAFEDISSSVQRKLRRDPRTRATVKRLLDQGGLK